MQQRRITSSGLFRFKSTEDRKRIHLNPQHAEAMRECGVCQRNPHLVGIYKSRIQIVSSKPSNGTLEINPEN